MLWAWLYPGIINKIGTYKSIWSSNQWQLSVGESMSGYTEIRGAREKDRHWLVSLHRDKRDKGFGNGDPSSFNFILMFE